MTDISTPDQTPSDKRSPAVLIVVSVLMTLLLLLAILWPTHWQSREQIAIRNLEESPSGEVTLIYDWWSAGQRTAPGNPIIKAWLGENYASHVVELWPMGQSVEELTAEIAHLPKLEFIALQDCEFNEELAHALIKHPALKKVWFTHLSPSCEALKVLARSNQIEKLYLLDTQVTDEQLAVIGDFPSLKYLCIDESTGTDEGLAKLGQLSTLRELRIHKMPQITDAGAAQLSTLTQLTRFWLPKSNITARSLAIASRMPHLDDFKMTCVPTVEDVTLPTAEIWPKLTELSCLQLDAPCIDDEDLVKIGQLRKLTYLTLVNPKVTGRGMAELARAPELQMLTLFGTHLTEKDLQPLSAAPNLYAVDISTTHQFESRWAGDVLLRDKPFDPNGPRPILPD